MFAVIKNLRIPAESEVAFVGNADDVATYMWGKDVRKYEITMMLPELPSEVSEMRKKLLELEANVNDFAK